MSTRATKSRVMKWTGAALLFGSIASAAPAAVQAASAKNNLTIGISEPNASWCAQDSPGLDQVTAKNSVLETLTMVNDKGKMVPYLAESVTQGADAKHWTVVLRDGIKYSDGSAFDAANVKANMYALTGLSKIALGGGQLPSLPAIAWLDMFGSSIDELSAGLKAAATGDLKAVMAVKAKVDAAVVVKDTKTIEFTLATPRPNFLFLLWNFGRTALLSTASLKSADCGVTPAATVGTGPFTLVTKGAVSTTTDTVLGANATYWRSTAKNPLPKAQQVTFKIITDSSSKVGSVQTGTVDIATFGVTEGTAVNRLRAMPDRVTLFQGPFETAWSIHLNTVAASGSPFASKNAREAFAYALNNDEIVQVVTKRNAKVSHAIAPPVHPWYQPNVSLKYNLKKAKESVAAYKTETGKDLSIVVPRTTTSSSGELADLICKQMAKAGIGCTVSAAVPSSTYISNGFALKQHMSNFNVSSGYYGDFAVLFATKTNLELSGFRFTQPTLAQCFTDARDLSTKAAYAPCVKELQAQSYWVPLYLESGFVAWTKKVSGVGATPLPAGGNRPVVGGSGFDFASVKKAS